MGVLEWVGFSAESRGFRNKNRTPNCLGPVSDCRRAPFHVQQCVLDLVDYRPGCIAHPDAHGGLEEFDLTGCPCNLPPIHHQPRNGNPVQSILASFEGAVGLEYIANAHQPGINLARSVRQATSSTLRLNSLTMGRYPPPYGGQHQPLGPWYGTKLVEALELLLGVDLRTYDGALPLLTKPAPG